MFDTTRLDAEIFHVQKAWSDTAAQPHGKVLLNELRDHSELSTHVLLRQSLLADCVRVAYCAVTTDITVRDREVEAIRDFVAMAARHYAAAMPATYGEFATIDPRAARTFLYRYAVDDGRFGRRAMQHWPGLMLCRGAEGIGQGEPAQRYAHLMNWLLIEACQLAGCEGAKPRWRNKIDDIEELRGLLGHTAEHSTEDLRCQAFLAPTRVFAAVQQASSVFDTDPFDVETIHADARRTFARLVDYATAPAQASSTGWMWLMLGNSGSGKTHLLRSFRHYVHEHHRGFVAYAPFHSNSDDYARHLLQHVVDSLSRPYAGVHEHTGLYELASGLISLADEPLKTQLQQLTEGNWEVTESADTFAAYIHCLTDQLQQRPQLQRFDPDLLRIMLLALYPVPGMTSRIYRYLRCLDLSADDREWLGHVVPRTGKDDAGWMLRALAHLAYTTRRAAFVILLDQAERSVIDVVSGSATFARAVDALNGVVSDVPSVVAVISYLSDLYDSIRPALTTSMLDRLERNPPIGRLSAQRTYAEIVSIVSRRLAWLYAEAGADYRSEAPVYPIPEHYLRNLVSHRSRDVLEWCHRFQSQCVVAGRVVETLNPDESWGSSDSDLEQLSAAWNDALQDPDIEIPDDEDQILALLGRAAADCANEHGLGLERSELARDGLPALRLSLTSSSARVNVLIAMTNRGPQAGAFGAQLAALRKGARNAVAIAVRTGAFPHGVASQRAIALLAKNGGRCVSLDEPTLRALVAFQRFHPAFPGSRIAAWQQIERPISMLPAIAEIFQLDRWSSVRQEPNDEPTSGGASRSGSGASDEPSRRRAKPRAPSQQRRRQPSA